MKKYWVERGEFANEYSLVWTDGGNKPEGEGWERVTRKEAARLCRSERARREYDASFAGYADTLIYPYAWGEEDIERWETYGDNAKLDEGCIVNPVLWYAVLLNEEDNDWGTGSYGISEACRMLRNVRESGYAGARIAVVNVGENDPVCVDEIR